MTINVDKILSSLNELELGISSIRDLLFCPEGVRIVAINRYDIAYIEFWDKENVPKILFFCGERVDPKYINHYIIEAINLIPPSYCGNTKIEIHTDLILDELSEGVQIGIEIFDIDLKDLDSQLIEYIKGRHDVNNYMSQLKNIQGPA